MAEYVFGIIVLICTVYVLIKIFPTLIKGTVWLFGLLGILVLFITLYFLILLPN